MVYVVVQSTETALHSRLALPPPHHHHLQHLPHLHYYYHLLYTLLSARHCV